MRIWKVYCTDNWFPGLWYRMYRQQCVALGWPPNWHRFHGKTDDHGLITARNAVARMEVGDWVVAALKGNRIAKLGQITGIHVRDDEWDPLVPPSKDLPKGQMGRRINVRWDLDCGPTDPDLSVALPPLFRLSRGELLPTIAEIRSQSIKSIREAMDDPANWVGALSFRYEKALSDYIAAFPHRLEDGMVPYPDAKVREKTFSDSRRLDVLLLDRHDRPVVVECKQGAPTLKDIQQLRHYLRRLREETSRKDVRGILIHGGSRKLHPDIERAACAKAPGIEIIQYRLQVEFASSDRATRLA